ncbi:MAG: hypothetical protein JSU63_20930 [Phycisphaerales bacterium]|nr:MAG: hypothetical protein JSU63_20930 [Phycisphaerales bacterium]
MVLDWQVTGPHGADRTDLLVEVDEFEAVLSAGPAPGPYIVRCTATDTDGLSSTASIVLTVGGTLGVVVTADKTSLGAGGGALHGEADLYVQAYGGKPPYNYTWSVLGPSGASAPGRLDSVTREDPTFTSSSTIGLYTVLCTVTDSIGDVAVDSVGISVGQPLNVDVTVDKQLLVSGGGVSGQAQVITTVNGGLAPYSYNWAVLDANGVAAPSRLTSTTSSAPVFTSSTATGTYRLTLTTTDATGVVFVDSVEIVVEDVVGTVGLSVDVSTSRQTVAPAGGTSTLTATTTGGVDPISYSWNVTDPSGTTENTRLDSTNAATVTFTGSTVQGTYRAVCTVTDAAGDTFTDSVQLSVSDVFTLDLTGDATNVSPAGTVNLVADRSGGSANFSLAWSCVDDSGAAAGSFGTGATGPGAALQVAADDASNTWVAPAAGPGALGTYRITVTATDSTGRSFTDSVMIAVSDAFLLNLSASSTHVGPGQSVNLTADRTGGSANFTYTFSSTNESDALAGTFTNGSLGVGTAQLVVADDTTNVWTAPNAGAGTLGTYRITVTALESGGVAFTDTVHVVVDDPFLLNLTADDSAIAPGGSTTLTADRSGGELTYSYVWAAEDSTGAAAGTFATGSTGIGSATQAGENDDAVNTWTAPSAAVGVADTYTITCVSTDALGSTVSDSVHVAVGADDTLTLDIVADDVLVAPGKLINLFANQTGGVSPFDYSYTATDEAGGAAGTLGAASQSGVAGDTTNTWTAPAAAAGTLGTYRIDLTVTDSIGDSFTDSLQVVVQSPLSLNLSSNSVYVAPLTMITLTADVFGGEADYDYTWSAKTSAGLSGGTFTIGPSGPGAATQSGESGDVTNGWSVVAEGNYTITCGVTGNSGQVYTDSISIIVTSQDVFSLDITADKRSVAPGEQVNLTGNRTGGIANFSYAWSAVNEGGAASGTWGAATQSAVADDTTNTWTAPTGTGVEGTYRISCTITDASSRTFTDSVPVEVGTLALQNVFLAPTATNTNSVLAGTALTALCLFPDPGQQIVAGLTNPVYPRNVVITINDADNSITGGTARVSGLDARGLSSSEVISIAASVGTSSTNTGLVPFATVTGIDLFAFTGADAGADQVSIGVGDKFGLTGVIDAAGDVAYVIEDGAVMSSGYTVDATSGRQSITFASAPNGARNYTVVFRAR